MLSTSSSHSIPASQQPLRPRQTTTQPNPLSDLIHTEKSYLETLRIIDSQIAPIWMKQTVSAAPDFSELLKYVHDILKVNKRFCMKLAKVASNPKALKELGDVLMQWIEDMEVPYANFARRFIPNLDKRSELNNNLSISHLLENLTANFKCKITLETLFEAPLKRLHYYKALYHKLLECTKQGRADHKLLLRANERIDTLINMSQNDVSLSKSPTMSSLHDSHRQQVRLKQQQREELKRMEEQIHEPLPSIKLDPNILASFMHQVDCSQVRDFFSRTSIRFKLQWKAPDVQLIMQDSFVMLPQHKNETSTRIRAALTTAELAICRELDFGRQKYCLMFPPLAVRQLSVRAMSLHRELVGEYLLQLTVNGTHHITMRADSREIRNAWVGASSTAPSASTLKPTPLATTVKQRIVQLQQEMSETNDRGYSMASSTFTKDDVTDNDLGSNKKSADVYALYSTGANGDVDSEPDELPRARRDAFRDTIMDFYDGRFFDDSDGDDHKEPPLPTARSFSGEPTTDSDGQDLANIQPRSIKILSRIPDPSEVKKISAVEEPPVPPVTPIPSNSSDSNQQKSSSSNNNSNNASDTNMGSAAVQMTYIEPETHKMTLSSSIQITQENDDNDGDDDDEDNRPLALSKPSSSPSSAPSTVKPPNSPILPRSSSRGAAFSRNQSPNPPSNNISKHPQQQLQQQQQSRQGGVNASNNDLQSVRSALAASVDSFAESTKSSPSDYSLARGSSSTVATERGSPSSIEQAKPVMSPPPRKGSMPENVARNEANTSTTTSNISSTQPQQQSQHTPVLLPRTSSARHAPAPIRTTSIRQQQYAQPLASTSTTTSQHHPLNRSEPSPAQSASTPTPRQLQKPPQLPPARLDSHKAPSTSLEDLASPPPSPGAFANATRQILYSHGRCEVFHWKDQRWYSAQESCSIHVRTTNANRSALSIQLLQSRQLYLNAWIVPTTVVEQQGDTDVSVSLYMGDKKENYLIHFDRRSDAVELTSVLQRVHFEATQLFGGPATAAGAAENGNGSIVRANSQRSLATSKTAPSLHSSPSVLHSVSLFDAPMPTDARSYLEQMPQTLSPLMQCRGKLYSQVDPTIWNSMGSITLRLAQQMPSKKMHVCIENDKHRLVSATVMSSNVKQVNPKRVSFLLTNEQTRTSMVYMVQLKDEKTTNKILEYIKIKNEENGW